MPGVESGVLFAAATILVATTSGGPSQVRLSPRVDAGIVAGIAAVDVAAYYVSRWNRSDPCPCDPAVVPAFDRVAIRRNDLAAAEASNILQYASIVGAPAIAFLTDPGTTHDRAESGLVVLEAMSVAGSLTQLAKAVVHRPRPHSYGSRAEPPFAYTSFPSGHATAAFSAASALTTIYALRHPHSRATPWIAGAGISVAAATAFLRVSAGRHFPSDVAAGALIGSASGWGIVTLHARAPLAFAASPEGVSMTLRFGSVR